MAKESCEVCGSLYNAKASNSRKPGYYKLCRPCRYDRQNVPQRYLCKAINGTSSKGRKAGDPCTQLRLFGSDYCSQHQEDNNDA